MRISRWILLGAAALLPSVALAQPATPPDAKSSKPMPIPTPTLRPGATPPKAPPSVGGKTPAAPPAKPTHGGATPAPPPGVNKTPSIGAPSAGKSAPAPPPALPSDTRRSAGGTIAPPAGPAPLANAPQEGQQFPELPIERAIEKPCPDKIPAGKKFKWDMRGETDLAQLVQWAAPTLCRPVIVPQNLRQQKVTIYSPGLVTAEEAQRLFLAALTSMGLTVQPEGAPGREVFTIIESNRSHELPMPLYGPDGSPPRNDSFVTKMIRLQFISTEEILQTLNRLKSKDGDIVAYAPAGTLIITDIAENIRRMETIIKQLDQQPLGGEKIFVVKLHNTAASEMAAMLEKVFQPTKGQAQPGKGNARINFSTPAPTGPSGALPGVSGEGVSPGGLGNITVSQIIPEDRSNTLIIVASERAYQHILALIKRLDQTGGPLDSAADRIHVYFLANASAEDMAGTLSGLGVGVAGGRGRTGARPGGGAPQGGGTPGQAGALFESEVKVAADKATNSLIIVASGRDYLTLRDLVRKLDITRRQVFIEATILEISLDKSRKLGLAFHGGDTLGTGASQSLLFGGSEPNSSVNSILFSPAALSGLAAGLRGPPIPGADTLLGLPPGQSIPSFGVFVQALQNNNDVNVVSMPHILTSDNEKATIEVGRNLPFPGSLGGFPGAGGLAGQAGGMMGGLGFGTSVQRQDVSLKLNVTPHVNDSDFVRLELDTEISDVASDNYNGLGPATDKRTAKTVVSVRDQQSVVIGGLVKDRVAESVDKVPLLGDIPILGYLFKYTSHTVLKQNLLIIITPYVIKDPQDLRRIFDRKIRDRKEFLERYSAFSDPNSYEPDVDYRRKRGLLEEINRTAVEAEIEATELRAAEASMQGRTFEGPVEPIEVPRGHIGEVPPPPPYSPGGLAPPMQAPEPAPIDRRERSRGQRPMRGMPGDRPMIQPAPDEDSQ